jgi:CheY-like chemotaxis protein
MGHQHGEVSGHVQLLKTLCLVVDDEEILARLSQRALDALGYDVEVATHSLAALALVRADPRRFAIVITDLTTPGMSGIILAAKLRQIRPRLPVILMTGDSAALTSEGFKQAGIDQVLLKPTTIQSLSAAVHAALAHSSRR